MIVSIGAFGAVFGFFGAIPAYLIAHRDQLEPTVRTKRMLASRLWGSHRRETHRSLCLGLDASERVP